MKFIVSLIVLILLALFAYVFFTGKTENVKEKNTEFPNDEVSNKVGLFQKYNLKTDTDKSLIDLDFVLSGGPGKDGIPSINSPKFVSIDSTDILDDVRGIFINLDGVRRFYPYSILVWHEIVNDSIGDVSFAVTFCPLCDSGIVFDRNVNNDILQFGVSGLLFESNLLMYDSKTESLWSQARGEAVVGDYLGTKLNILPFQLLTFKELKEKYPDTSVLSKDTGFLRDYTGNPYSGYDSTEDTIFPVSVTDDRFHAKELFYIIPIDNLSVSFPYRNLSEGTHSFQVNDTTLVIERIGGEIYASVSEERVPGYFEYWFSWIIHNKDNGVILDI